MRAAYQPRPKDQVFARMIAAKGAHFLPSLCKLGRKPARETIRAGEWRGINREYRGDEDMSDRDDMSDTEAVQQRITKALDRVKQGLKSASTQTEANVEAMTALQQDLANEKLAGEQLEARLKSVLEKQQSDSEATEVAQKERDEAVTKLDSELQSLRQANQTLRQNNQALRQANAAGLADPELINSGVQAELEALRADQAAGRAEADVVLAELGQLMAEVNGATQGGDA